MKKTFQCQQFNISAAIFSFFSSQSLNLSSVFLNILLVSFFHMQQFFLSFSFSIFFVDTLAQVHRHVYFHFFFVSLTFFIALSLCLSCFLSPFSSIRFPFLHLSFSISSYSFKFLCFHFSSSFSFSSIHLNFLSISLFIYLALQTLFTVHVAIAFLPKRFTLWPRSLYILLGSLQNAITVKRREKIPWNDKQRSISNTLISKT